MVNVRHFRHLAPGALLAFVAMSACGKKDEAPVDTTTVAPVEAPAPVLKAVVIPTWPSDTSTFAVDRPSALRPQLRARVRRCTDATPVVTADSIGPIYPGQSFANLLRACERALPVFHFDDGRYGPAVAVLLGKALVIADLDGVAEESVVTRVAAFDRAKTAEGIGPGSPLANVRRAYGAPTWRRFQCSVDALFDTKPGLVARITLPEEGSDAITCNEMRRFAQGADFSNFPRGSRVAWIATELAGVR
jgi:hypothetical protein